MKTAKLFKNGQSQAVRLPKEFRFNHDEKVFIKKMGNVIVLIPTDAPWESLFNSLDKFSEDFLSDRNQPHPQKRDDFF